MGEVIQHWRGYVVEDRDETVLCRFETVQGEGGDIEAEVYRHAFAVEDRAGLKPGTFLEWTITDDRRSDLRVPAWAKVPLTADEIAAIEAESQRIKELLGLPDFDVVWRPE